MKVIYSGGYDKYVKESVHNSVFYRYADALNEQLEQGKVVASINFAKPDSYYDSRLDEIFQGKVLSIDCRNQSTLEWEKYDIILMPGGNQTDLKTKLLETGFSINKLKKSVVVIGDSAGAYVMARYFPAYDGPVEEIDKRHIEKFVEEGLYPESNVLVIAHVNNTRYVPREALELIVQLSDKFKVLPVSLRENEDILLDEDGNLVPVDMSSVFGA